MEIDHVLPEPENLTLQAVSFGFQQTRIVQGCRFRVQGLRYPYLGVLTGSYDLRLHEMLVFCAELPFKASGL